MTYSAIKYFLPNSVSQEALVCNSLQILREHIPPSPPLPHDFPVGDNFWEANLLKDVLHGRVNDQGFKGGEVQLGGSKWGLPYGLLCGTSAKRKLCMVSCHICRIYEIWSSRGWGCFEVIISGWKSKSQEWGGGFNRKGEVGFLLYVIQLY